MTGHELCEPGIEEKIGSWRNTGLRVYSLLLETVIAERVLAGFSGGLRSRRTDFVSARTLTKFHLIFILSRSRKTPLKVFPS